MNLLWDSKVKMSISIQAGGESRRMGQNKALLPFMGHPLIQRVIEQVRSTADELFIIANDRTLFEFLNVTTVSDQIRGLGVLGGLYTALITASQPFVAPIACDMPFINPLLLRAELNLLVDENADVVIPKSTKGLELLHAVFRRDVCLPYVEETIQQGQRRMTGWLDRVKVRVMTPAEIAILDPTEKSFININTPSDLAQAESIAEKLASDNLFFRGG